MSRDKGKPGRPRGHKSGRLSPKTGQRPSAKPRPGSGRQAVQPERSRTSEPAKDQYTTERVELPERVQARTGGSVPAGHDVPASDAQTREALEFPQLLETVAGFCQTPMGRRLVLALLPSGDPDKILRRLERLSQLRELLELDNGPGLSGLEDISPLLDRLTVEGAFLLPEELEAMADFISVVNRAASFLDQSPEDAHELFLLRNRLTPLPELARRVRSIIGPGQTVSSKASPALASIRRELNSQRERLRSQLSSLFSESGAGAIFSDSVVTQRADRFVVPVKTDAKGRVKGIIHDTSGSGATCFVEPLEAIEGNNKLALLRRQEQEEEARILMQVARDLAVNHQALSEDLEAVGKLDCLLAQAKFCSKLDCQHPQMTSGQTLELIQAKHPLLAWRAIKGQGRVVPINLNMDPASCVLVISGANAGGKTATLKTIGLLSLMAMCGLHVPCSHGSRLPFYSQVMAEIGDDQDLDKELSTFTSHAGRLALMLNQARPGALLLIDELGNGTDPGEGAALGISILEELIRREAKVFCTTHFHRLKAFASLTEGVENVSVSFDSRTRQPTFQLHYGAPGFSDALEVSRNLGFPQGIISRARELVSGDEKETVALLRQARDDRQRAAAERDEARKQRLAAQASKADAKELFKKAKKERANALAEGKRRVRQVAKELESRLEHILGQAKTARESGQAPKAGRVKQELYQARRSALDQVDQVLETGGGAKGGDAGGKVNQLKAGAAVKLNNLNQTGVLLEDVSPEAETVAVSVGVKGVRVLARLSDLEPASQAPEKPKQVRVAVQAAADDGLDLKLIGMRVDDALPLVDKAVDQALLAGRTTVRVVHGVGTGRLRNAVRQYLKSHPSINGLKNEAVKRGGLGVTIAELRA